MRRSGWKFLIRGKWQARGRRWRKELQRKKARWIDRKRRRRGWQKWFRIKDGEKDFRLQFGFVILFSSSFIWLPTAYFFLELRLFLHVIHFHTSHACNILHSKIVASLSLVSTEILSSLISIFLSDFWTLYTNINPKTLYLFLCIPLSSLPRFSLIYSFERSSSSLLDSLQLPTANTTPFVFHSDFWSSS